MSERQTGIVAFLFTDIEGSTRLWEADQQAMSAALTRHDTILRDAIATHGGRVFKTAGDAFCAVFPETPAAVAAAIAGQRALAAESWPTTSPLRVRMAIHAGHAEVRDGDYFGPALNRVARLLASAHGEQTVISRTASELAAGALPSEVSLGDLGEFELRGLHLPERISQVVAPGLRHDFPPLQTPERLIRNVPRPSTPLLGREDAIQSVRHAFGLVPGNETERRLLTLTGPGGTGKTRLSLHLARELGVELPDGSAFVSLSTVTDADQVPAAIAAALELGESSESVRDQVFDHLRDRRLLLVLDNLEQVMRAAPLIADLAAHCPRLLVLVTSRERLNVRGELELPLPPLALPTPETTPSGARLPLTVAQVCQSPAVQLFVARAKSVKPDFAVTEDNASTIAEICRRLDGLPLAIELAAARARLLSPQAMLVRFDNRLELLNRGSRDLPDRQRTMRDTIAWSYDLLDSAEQRLFAMLAIFVGGADVEAAEQIINASDDESLADNDSLAVLESLADKSLVRLYDDRETTRLFMFETIRDFALEQLQASDAWRPSAQAHAEHFLALAESTEPRLTSREQARLLAQLDRDRANLRAAIDWFRQQRQCEEALRLGSALWRFWSLRGDIAEGRALLLDLVAEAGDCDPQLRAKALNGAGVLAESQGDLDLAAKLHQESLNISRAIGDLHGVAWALDNLGVVEINRGNFAMAAARLEEALAVAESITDHAAVATILIDLEQVAHHQSDPERSFALLTRALALFRALGDESQVARTLNNLAMVALEQGEPERAQDLLSESLSLHRSVGDRQGIASTLNNLAEVLGRQGRVDEAIALLLESQLLAIETGNRLYAAIATCNLAFQTMRLGEHLAAAMHYREALLLSRAVGDQQGVLSALVGLAGVAQALGEPRQAVALLAASTRMIDEIESLELPEFGPSRQSLRDELGERLYNDAWRFGMTTRREALITLVAEQGAPLPLPALA